MKVAQNIKRLRMELGLLQSELANKIGVHVSAISHWEKGARKPSPAIMLKLVNLAKKHKIKMKVEDFF